MPEVASVLCELSAGVATVTLNRPEKRNAMNREMAAALGRVLGELAGRVDCQVIVMRGAGGQFCAGWDIQEFPAQMQDPEGAAAGFTANLALLDTLAAVPQVTVAAVEGYALGYGVSLVAHCDLALASADASFGLPEVRVGILPGLVMLDAQRVLPRKNALEWLLTGALYGAEEARRLGLVGRVVAGEHWEVAVRELAERLAAQSPTVLRELKALYRHTEVLPARRAAEKVIDSLRTAIAWPDAAEGVAAFQERRRPRWQALNRSQREAEQRG